MKNTKLTLTAEAREILGKKVKKLRREGKIPGNIFGTNFKSKAISFFQKDFLSVYKVAHETGVVYVKTGSDETPVLIKQVQRHPLNDYILHVDLRKIDLTQKLQTQVPVNVVGQSPAVTQKGGVLLKLAETLTVEALPQDIPPHIAVDISKMEEIGAEIKVSDLTKSPKYEYKDLETKVVVSVVAHKEESVTPEITPTAAPEVITAKTEEGVEAPSAEGAKPGTTTTKESAKPEPSKKSEEKK